MSIDLSNVSLDLLPKRIRSYDDVKELKTALGKQGVKVNLPDLLGLSRTNDPFYFGSDGDKISAEWIAEKLNYVGLNIPGIHIRRPHYRFVVQPEPIKRWDKKTNYQNDTNSWSALNRATKSARYLGTVDVENFEDHRNPKPDVFMEPNSVPQPSINKHLDYWNWDLPEIRFEFNDAMDWYLPYMTVEGYQYSTSDQPVVIEVWIEKSTLNNVVVPLCEKYALNFVCGIGFQSITGAIGALKRIENFASHGNQKPLRIFYLSDFDPGGVMMPVGIARQIEYWIDRYTTDADIKLTSLALTEDQVKSYEKLVTSPIKSTDKRMNKFQERYNVNGAIEIDALEEIYPGELEKIITNAVIPYRDMKIAGKLNDAYHEADDLVDETWKDDKKRFEKSRDEIKKRALAITDKYKDELKVIADRIQKDFDDSGIQNEIDDLRNEISEAINDFDVKLPERPMAIIDIPDESNWLYDSGRSYLEQLQFYHDRRNGFDVDNDDVEGLEE